MPKVDSQPGKHSVNQFKVNRVITLIILVVGIALLAISAFYNSTIAAVIGLGLTIWGAILLYVAPSKHVPLELLNATAISGLSNLERIIADSNLRGKGFYLPPKYLKDPESSVVFISSKPEQGLPALGEIDDEKLNQKRPSGICLTPPGLALSKLFEQELGRSFTRTDLDIIEKELAKLLIENTEIADDAQIKKENGVVTIEIANSMFSKICQETRSLQKTHELLGCPLTSAIACALAKAAGKPITIEKEEQTQDGKATKIQYRVLEE
jgi:hypothetical protein